MVLTHRYLGVLLGLLVLMWFASGVVMLFVHWPEVDEAGRAAGLAEISWNEAKAFPEELRTDQEAGVVVVEAIAGRPAIRIADRVFDLRTGLRLAGLDRASADVIAEAYAAGVGLKARAESARLVSIDQWTVTGRFDDRRPYWRIRMDDRAGSVIHVSARTGEVAQHTTASERALAWIGPVPHWLYPQILRRRPRLWTEVVIWTSTAALLLTLSGLWLGLVALRPRRGERRSPFRGVMWWHHVTGLATGLLTVTWMVSGLFSMQPWGFLESPPDPRFAAYERSRITMREALDSLEAVGETAPDTRRLRLTPFDERPYWMADQRRLDAWGRPAPLSASDLALAARRLGPIATQGPMTGEDAYWYGHHGSVRLPVWRVVLKDGTRAYLDPDTAEVLGRFDRSAQAFRWLHSGLHRLDLIRGFDRGAAWAAAMALLLAACTIGAASGVWLGIRRIRLDAFQATTGSPWGRRKTSITDRKKWRARNDSNVRPSDS